MMQRLEGRIAAVIGGGSGMGRAISHRLASEGAHVHVVDLSGDAAKAVADEITSSGGAAEPEQVDASKVAELRDLFAKIDSQHGKLHVLHNQVGMPGPGGLDVSEADFDQSINVNVKPHFYGAALGFELLKKADGKGSMIFVASTSALVGSINSPLYSLAKGAIVSFTRAVALAGAPVGVRANVICPGPVDTPMLPRFFARDTDVDPEVIRTTFMQMIPMGRASQPEEIAGVVAWLASDDSSFVTGVTIPVDGGQVAK
jgi:NAD(P)-dependent dehydrogenase (short-subunit alcohol dehydrogenase family)